MKNLGREGEKGEVGDGKGFIVQLQKKGSNKLFEERTRITTESK